MAEVKYICGVDFGPSESETVISAALECCGCGATVVIASGYNVLGLTKEHARQCAAKLLWTERDEKFFCRDCSNYEPTN